MRHSSKLSSVLHVLLHLSQSPHPLTSEAMARFLQTNPVVVRRELAGLRQRGWVRSEKGHGGGWTLACALSDLTIGDIYRALGEPAFAALSHRSANPACIIERAVNGAVATALHDAEALLVSRFDAISLADLANAFQQRLAQQGQGGTPLDH